MYQKTGFFDYTDNIKKKEFLNQTTVLHKDGDNMDSPTEPKGNASPSIGSSVEINPQTNTETTDIEQSSVDGFILKIKGVTSEFVGKVDKLTNEVKKYNSLRGTGAVSAVNFGDSHHPLLFSVMSLCFKKVDDYFEARLN